MGIRSLLRNAFGRSKATREETGAAPSGADTTPESATIPEAREESVPAPSAPAPEAEVPAARTAPPAATDAPAADPAPAAPTLPAQGSRPDVAERAAETSAAREESAAQEESAARDEAEVESVDEAEVRDEAVTDLVSQAFDNPTPPAAEPEAAAEAEPEAVTEPEPEPQAVAEPEAAVTEPEPEPKAVAEAAPEPQAAPEPAPAPEPVAPAAADTTGTATPPALVSLVKSAAATLDKHGLGTQRAAVYLVLDRSGSMRNYYKDGTVQNLAEQALALATRFDDDATVPVVFFSTDVDGTADLDLTNYEGRIAELHAGLGHMGRTNYHWAINAVIEHYKKSGSTAPAFVIFQTDGAPTSKPAAEKALCEAAGLPLFWQFIGFGDPDAKGFDFLRKLDDLSVPEKRVIDNAGFFHAGRDPRGLSHDALYQQLMVEFPEWLTEARGAGILKDS
ncbi:vWA domain-containing protein [Streptomyces kronopolitis]|uniref:vWA domain-containing protein n=1 Tax=Streptomyces kronopolitis TaxID=1612435 RepID=UPI0020C11ED1|nr:VWA domain-containing protein [Streptomyces kronopolitis]MCL6297208.1 VWA domain-containing protein [Streptomyces kronopolitis]